MKKLMFKASIKPNPITIHTSSRFSCFPSVSFIQKNLLISNQINHYLQDSLGERNKLLTESSQRYHPPLDLQRHGQMTARKLIPEETVTSDCNLSDALMQFSLTHTCIHAHNKRNS